jgi:hypothetical protein
MRDLPLGERTLESLRDECAGYLLQEFVADGGKGLKSALWTAMVAAIQWKAERDEAEEAKTKAVEAKGKKRAP